MSFTWTKTDWKPSDFYNIEDWVRLRENLEFINQWCIERIWPSCTLQDTSTPRGLNELPVVALVNRLESNLQLIYETVGIPLTEWQDSKTWYARLDAQYSANPNSDDWNRWEQLPKRLKECIDFVDTYLHKRISGNFYAGNSIQVQYFSRGR